MDCMTAPLAPSDEVRAYAEALRRLRIRARDGRGVSQETAATAIGQRKQSWQAYEAGRRQMILRSDVQDRMTRALGFTRADLECEKKLGAGVADPGGRPDGAGQHALPLPPPAHQPQGRPASLSVPVWGRGRGGARGAQIYDVAEPERWLDLTSLCCPSSRAMQLIGDSVYPWAASGTTIVYDLDRWPRKDQGCVVETKDHGYYIKLFDRSDDDKVYVRELQPEERTIEFALADIVGVYAVKDRIDP